MKALDEAIDEVCGANLVIFFATAKPGKGQGMSLCRKIRGLALARHGTRLSLEQIAQRLLDRHNKAVEAMTG